MGLRATFYNVPGWPTTFKLQTPPQLLFFAEDSLLDLGHILFWLLCTLAWAPNKVKSVKIGFNKDWVGHWKEGKVAGTGECLQIAKRSSLSLSLSADMR